MSVDTFLLFGRTLNPKQDLLHPLTPKTEKHKESGADASWVLLDKL